MSERFDEAIRLVLRVFARRLLVALDERRRDLEILFNEATEDAVEDASRDIVAEVMRVYKAGSECEGDKSGDVGSVG